MLRVVKLDVSQLSFEKRLPFSDRDHPQLVSSPKTIRMKRPRVERRASPQMVEAVAGQELVLHCRFEANPMRGSQVSKLKIIDTINHAKEQALILNSNCKVNW